MERKLRLVPTAPPRAGDGEAEISAEEREAAEALRDAIDRGEAPAVEAIRAAFAPAEIAADDLDSIVARALGDEAAATRAERDAAERLRAELDREVPVTMGPQAAPNPGALRAPVREAAIFEQIRIATNPPALDPAKNEALIDAALARAGRSLPARRGVVRRLGPVTIATASGITALAAGLALFFGQPRVDSTASSAAAMIRARSADELFDPSTPFPRSGDESARVDRIATARAGDLRKNRFASWGVR